jgi:hypothetical protein
VSDGYVLGKECPAPDITRIKGFIRWYAHSTKGRLSSDGRPTVITTLACAERFFGGFETATGNVIAAEDRSETYGVSIVRFTKAFDVEANRITVDQRNPDHGEGHCENGKRQVQFY